MGKNRGGEIEVERLNLTNRKLRRHSADWQWRCDCKKFGWGYPPKNNHSKRGLQSDKQYRKDKRRAKRLYAHKQLMHIPFTPDEVAFLRAMLFLI